MEFSDYLNALRRRWALISILAIIGGVGGYVLAQATPPMYRATSSVFVSARGGDSPSDLVQGSTFTQNLMQSYAQLADMPSVLEPVIEQLDLDRTPAQLANSVSAENPLNTVIIEVSATSGSPEQAAEIANAVSEEMSAAAQRLSPSMADGTPSVSMNQVAEAQPPRFQYEPNTRLLVITGLAIGLLLGGIIALGREVLDTRIRTDRDLRRVTDAPLLGVVPVKKDKTGGMLVMRTAPGSFLSESYRRIAANLGYINPGTTVDSVVVTSPLPHEGKSTVAINLALALAENFDRVLLVDADLRRPMIADYCQIDDSAGLTTALSGAAELQTVIERWGSIDVLPAGPVPPNPNQLLASVAMEQVVAALTAEYDIVIFDSAPLMPVSDSLALTRLTSGALLVTRSGATKRGHVRAAIESVEAVNADLLGIVINRVKQDRKGLHYGYETRQAPGTGAPADVVAAPAPTEGELLRKRAAR